ncbi:MAG: N-acetyltransferase family protein [Bdellovibrionota bacterium]
MNIRPAEPGDLPAYFEHCLRHFRESGNSGDVLFHPIRDFEEMNKEVEVAKMLEAITAPLSRPGWQRIWIAEIGGEIVADCLLRSSHMMPTLHRCQFAIGVERTARGQGLGGRLSMQAISWARQQSGLDWVDLWVFAHNSPAIALYEKLGFSRVDVVRDQFRLLGQKVDDLHMTLSLAR